ncbi:lantibiotic dehydratase C-terminal domain-containing protein [Sphingobacterium shayense]|uniref:lantibiotic dehydratase C-terminal domain-containing protein n=1 Tax=Sphingobacterium shayense TaxID=626343 RepID=UPI003CCDB827
MIYLFRDRKKILKYKYNRNKYNQLVSSAIHMLMNRLFVYNHRYYELIIYDFLTMYYKNQIYRTKKNM